MGTIEKLRGDRLSIHERKTVLWIKPLVSAAQDAAVTQRRRLMMTTETMTYREYELSAIKVAAMWQAPFYATRAGLPMPPPDAPFVKHANKDKAIADAKLLIDNLLDSRKA